MNIIDPEEISKICHGLAHPVRAKIIKLLESDSKIPLHIIEKKLRGTEFEKSYQTINSHIKKMELYGLVETSKDDKNITIVVLKKKIEILAEDV